MFKTIAYIEKDPETGLYVAVVPGIPGAHAQAETLDELQKNLTEVVVLCLEEATLFTGIRTEEQPQYLTSGEALLCLAQDPD